LKIGRVPASGSSYRCEPVADVLPLCALGAHEVRPYITPGNRSLDVPVGARHAVPLRPRHRLPGGLRLVNVRRPTSSAVARHAPRPIRNRRFGNRPIIREIREIRLRRGYGGQVGGCCILVTQRGFRASLPILRTRPARSGQSVRPRIF